MNAIYSNSCVCVCVWVGERHTATWNQEKSNWVFICVKYAHKTTKINLGFSLWGVFGYCNNSLL